MNSNDFDRLVPNNFEAMGYITKIHDWRTSGKLKCREHRYLGPAAFQNIPRLNSVVEMLRQYIPRLEFVNREYYFHPGCAGEVCTKHFFSLGNVLRPTWRSRGDHQDKGSK